MDERLDDGGGRGGVGVAGHLDALVGDDAGRGGAHDVDQGERARPLLAGPLAAQYGEALRVAPLLGGGVVDSHAGFQDVGVGGVALCHDRDGLLDAVRGGLHPPGQGQYGEAERFLALTILLGGLGDDVEHFLQAGGDVLVERGARLGGGDGFVVPDGGDAAADELLDGFLDGGVALLEMGAPLGVALVEVVLELRFPLVGGALALGERLLGVAGPGVQGVGGRGRGGGDQRGGHGEPGTSGHGREQGRECGQGGQGQGCGPEPLRLLGRARGCHGDLLMGGGEQDPIIPTSQAQSMRSVVSVRYATKIVYIPIHPLTAPLRPRERSHRPPGKRDTEGHAASRLRPHALPPTPGLATARPHHHTKRRAHAGSPPRRMQADGERGWTGSAGGRGVVERRSGKEVDFRKEANAIYFHFPITAIPA